ncbi:MAG: hypothetical protein EB127_08880 [Alphaproteobacteria bacterium]|nr:hypothetical protein [Alphaproteobacteria bacterium]
MTKKVLQPTNDAYIQFTEEELQEIGAGPGTKFSVKLHDDGSVELRPYVKMEIEISDWPREVLEMLISDSCEKDISVNDVIADLLKKSLEQYPTNEDLEQAKKELLLEKDYLYKGDIDPNFTNNDIGLPGGSTYLDHTV